MSTHFLRTVLSEQLYELIAKLVNLSQNGPNSGKISVQLFEKVNINFNIISEQ